MKILFQHDGVFPVQKYGGIERILYWHMRKLVELGHKVVMIGDKKSNLSPLGVELIAKEKEWESLIPSGVDIIHLYYNYKPQTSIPTIFHIHGNGKKGESFPENTVFLGKKHAQNHSSSLFVPNALDLREYPFDGNRTFSWENFLFLAKASWSVKNLKSCIMACKRVQKSLHIAGGRYFWPSRWIKSHGMVGGEKKLAIMNRCDALLFPVRWHEPFGLAIIESMAMGLPAVGSPYGSIPEIITEETGIIVRNLEELVSVLETPQKFDHHAIRSYIEKHFSFEIYTNRFLSLYERILDGETLSPEVPGLGLKNEAQKLLAF